MKRILKLFTMLISTAILFGCTKTNTPYKKKGNRIYFGTYPQKLVDDSKMIDSLNKLSGDLPSSDNLNNWKDYNYYIESKIESYMYYQDIDYNNDGSFDYRGVYFTKYRPNHILRNTDESFQLDNGYKTNNIYWFKYEKIEWEILEKADGKALIMTSLVIDTQDFYSENGNGEFEHNGGTGYSNNYELSNIRIWLNDNFYNTAFSTLEKANIEKTLVDNSRASSGMNCYESNDTNDYVFLLSLTELSKYLPNSDDRRAMASDYAWAQGLDKFGYNNGYTCWRLRSPDSAGPGYAWCLKPDGFLGGGGVCYTCFGERPALWINLD